ncbi:MAG: phosphatase PAP2 family protein [Lapillicoccus sp.]
MPDRVSATSKRDGVLPPSAATSGSAWRWRLRGVLPGVVGAVVTAIAVSALALLVQERLAPLAAFDHSVILAATDVTRAHPGLQSALLAWQAALQPLNVYVVATVVCLGVGWRAGLRSRAIWSFVTMMVAWNLALDLKLLVQRVRPLVAHPVSTAPGYSFPSGHVANAAAAVTALAILLWPLLDRGWQRTLVVGSAAVIVVVTALDRVYLGVHYPSDTLAGILVGTGVVVASFLGYRGWRRHRPARPHSHPTPTLNQTGE